VDGRTAAERTRARRIALYWLLFAAAVVTGAAVLLVRERAFLRPEAPSVEPLALVPPGPTLLLTVDVARLRADPQAAQVFGRELGRFDAGAGRAAWSECVPKLSGDIARVAVAVTNASSFAAIAVGRFTKAAALACARASVGNGAALRTTIGSFETVRDPQKSGELAARDGLLVVSDGDYLRAVLDRAEGQRDAAAAPNDRDRLHAELRRTVGQGAPIVLSVVLARGWLGGLLGDPEAERSPFAVVRTAALRANVTSGPDANRTSALDVNGSVACENEADAARLERFLTTLRADLGAEHADGALALLSALTLVRHGAALDFSGRVALSDAVKLLPP